MKGSAADKNEGSMLRVGLLGQPNTGKSTFFNGVTGARQHVGNWPGKTVEQKTGQAEARGKKIEIVDLPGTYSLSAASAEEQVTREFVCGGTADAVIALVDAAQLERSMYLLADYAGIGTPVIVALNMTDVARSHGKEVDAARLSEKLGVPVIPTIATKKEGLARLLEGVVEQCAQTKGASIRDTELAARYRKAFGESFDRLAALMPKTQNGGTPAWLALKLLEGDKGARKLVADETDAATLSRVDAILAQHEHGALAAADCKFEWIRDLLSDVVVQSELGKKQSRGSFDRIATHPVWGKPLAFFIMLFGFALSMCLAMPIMAGFSALIPVTSNAIKAGLGGIGAPTIIVSLLTEALTPGIYMSIVIAAFMLGVSLVFGFLEDIGYMARMAFVFDSLMSKLGLHGKSIMPFILSFGCNMGGISGARVIDSQQQRILTIATSMVIPCASIWGVTALVSGLFFGSAAPWVILSLFVLMFVHIKATSWVFGRKFIKDMDRTGLIMELPPYHKPNWKTILGYVWSRLGGALEKAMKIILGVSAAVWALSYSPTGDVRNSLIYAIGKFIEPVGLLFGLDWRLFTAFIISALGKEAALGVIAILFGVGSGGSSLAGTLTGGVHFDTAALSTALISTVPKAQALAFQFAFFFNVPCMAALAAVRYETRSMKWTLAIAGYYIAVALFLAGAAYRVGLAIF